jgi:tetratricopeptide (TPR) repeat protein
MKLLVRALLAALLVLGVAASSRADRDHGLAAIQAGRAALARQDWEGAKEQFQRAIEEDATLADARLGLAEAMWGAGDRPKALDAFRSLATALEEGAPLTKDDVGVYARTRQILLQSGPGDAALDAILRKHADAQMGIAIRWTARDAKVAELALRTALLLAPDHPNAGVLLAGLPVSGVGKPIVLFSGQNLGGWQWMVAPQWTFSEGTILANIPDKPMLAATNDSWSGDFDVVVEARLKEEFPKNGPPYFSVMAPWVDQKHTVGLGIRREHLWWFEKTGAAEDVEHFSKPLAELKGIDPTNWTTFTLKFRGDFVSAQVNAVPLGKVQRQGPVAAGRVCLKVQCCTVAFRRVELIPR